MTNLTQPQINRRKKAGAELTRATSAIGLGSLGVLGAAAAAPRLARGGKLARIGVTEEKANRFKERSKNTLIASSAISGGIGGINGFNNASWQAAEAKQRKKVVKNMTASPFDDPVIFGDSSGSEVSKALQTSKISTPGMGALRPIPKPMGQRPVSPNVKNMRAVPIAQNTAGLSKAFDSERSRMKRTDAYQTGAIAGAGAAGAAAVGEGAKSLGSFKSSNPQVWNKNKKNGHPTKLVFDRDPVKSGLKHGGRAAGLAAGAAGAGYAAHKIGQKKQGSWQPYAR